MHTCVIFLIRTHTPGSADVGVIGVTAGFCVVLVLVLAISISVFIIVHIQKLNKKGKTQYYDVFAGVLIDSVD